MSIFGFPAAQSRKAIVGGIVGAGSVFATAIADGHITWPEGSGILAAFFIGFGTVFGIKNAAPKESGK